MKRFLFLFVPFLLLSIAVPASATNGNNGFVKVSDEVVADTIPQNHPHVSCTFKVEFYNYDQKNTNATVTFELQAPTNKGQTLTVVGGNLKPFIGGDKAGGGKDLDARETYKLRFSGKEHEQQGYHVKLTVNAPGSKGSDKKHKVFWVKPCASTPQTLGTQTEMPSILPSTGFADFGVAIALSALTAAVAYLGAFLRKKIA